MRAYAVMTRSLQSDGSFTKVSMREYDILYALSKSKAPLTQSELLDAVVLSQPALSRMLKRLENADLICRSRHHSDGRAFVLELTDLGRQTQREIGRLHGKAVAQALYSGLDLEQVHALQELCERITESQREDGPWATV